MKQNKLQKSTLKYRRENMRKVGLARGQRYKMEYLETRKQAIKDFQRFKQDPLFLAGLCLYWGEGYKNEEGNIRITNTDSDLLSIFILFLKKYFGDYAKRTKVHLLLYQDLDEKNCLQYWSGKLKIPHKRFIKSTFIKGRHQTRRLPYGVAMVYFCSKTQKKKLMGWIDCLKKERAF